MKTTANKSTSFSQWNHIKYKDESMHAKHGLGLILHVVYENETEVHAMFQGGLKRNPKMEEIVVVK